MNNYYNFNFKRSIHHLLHKHVAPVLHLLLLLIVVTLNAKAQNDCTSKLNHARELFSSGQIEEIPSLLDSCLQNGFTKEEKIQADLLLIQVYLFDSNREKAEMVMNSFLRNFPDYKIQSGDPVEFTELYKSFRIKPTWGLGVIGGINLPHIIVQEHFSTENLNKLNSSYTPAGVGFDFGFHMNRYFQRNLWATLDLQYSIINFKRKDMLGNNLEDINFSEKTGWLSAPLYVNYSFGENKFSPYVFAGADFGYLFVDKTYILRHNRVDNTIPDIVQKSRDNRNNRELINIWAKAGIGLQYRALNGFFNFAIGYNYGLMPYVKGSNQYTDNNGLYYYQYIDDNFKVNRVTCSLGYSRLFYRIKKKKIENVEIK